MGNKDRKIEVRYYGGKEKLLSFIEAENAYQAAKQHFQNLSICRFDRIALVIEPEAGKDFEVIKLLELYP